MICSNSLILNLTIPELEGFIPVGVPGAVVMYDILYIISLMTDIMDFIILSNISFNSSPKTAGSVGNSLL